VRWLLPLLLVGCLAPFSPDGAIPFTPPPVYQEYWAKDEACSGIHARMQIHWYHVPQGYIIDPEGHAAIGLWVYRHDVYLADGYMDESTVRHEMLHDLIGHPGHGPLFTTCGL